MRIRETIAAGKYNRLLEVMEADAALSALGRDAVLAGLGAKIVEHGLEESVGLRLMHKHHRLLEGEVMIEREAVDEAGDACLATIAEPRSVGQTAAFANSWSFEGGELLPLEFSDDPMVGEQARRLPAAKAFLGEFRSALETLGAGRLIGICALDRSYYRTAKPEALDAELVEHTDEITRANIVKFRPSRGLDKDALVETVWRARDVVEDLEVMVTCDSDVSCAVKCLPVAVIHCEPNSDGSHSRETQSEHRRPHETTRIHTPVP